jgi:hypothetical protein
MGPRTTSTNTIYSGKVIQQQVQPSRSPIFTYSTARAIARTHVDQVRQLPLRRPSSGTLQLSSRASPAVLVNAVGQRFVSAKALFLDLIPRKYTWRLFNSRRTLELFCTVPVTRVATGSLRGLDYTRSNHHFYAEVTVCADCVSCR